MEPSSCPRCGVPWRSGAGFCVTCGLAAQAPDGVLEVGDPPVEAGAPAESAPLVETGALIEVATPAVEPPLEYSVPIEPPPPPDLAAIASSDAVALPLESVALPEPSPAYVAPTGEIQAGARSAQQIGFPAALRSFRTVDALIVVSTDGYFDVFPPVDRSPNDKPSYRGVLPELGPTVCDLDDRLSVGLESVLLDAAVSSWSRSHGAEAVRGDLGLGRNDSVGAPVGRAVKLAGRRIPVTRRVVAFVVALVALVGLIAIGSVSAFVVLNAFDPSIPTNDLVTKMVARDVTASTYLESADSLRSLATMMGILDVPGSASLSVENLQVNVPIASPAASRLPSGDWTITAKYTLKWSGKGSSGKVDQTLSAVVRKAADGKTRLVEIGVSPTLTFDLAAYFGAAGASEADATKVAEDLRSGSKWIPGVGVEVVPGTAAVTLPDNNTPVSGHLATWQQIVSPAVAGTRTTWNVQVTSGAVTYVSIPFASAVTSQPVAAEVNVGSITDVEARDQGATTVIAFWADVEAGDVAKANSLVVAGPKLSASAVARMKGWSSTTGGLEHSLLDGTSSPDHDLVAVFGEASEGSGGPEFKLGDAMYVLAPSGTWGIDTSRSHLIQTVLGGNGHVYPLIGKQIQDGVAICQTQIGIALSRVVFYTDETAPEAVFSFTSSRDCELYDEIISATVGWSGNSGGVDLEPGVSGTDGATPVERVVELPAELKSPMGPVWIKVTKYGDPGGAVLPNTLTFSTN